MNTTNKEFYSSKYDINKESQLKNKLEAQGFTFKTINHAFWSAQNNGVTITLYKSGKVLVQGKNTEECVNQFLEGSNQLSIISTQQKAPAQTKLEFPKPKIDCWIGTDESGKGDYFGPLVVAGVLVDQSNIKKFQEIGIRDCKKVKDESIARLALQIKANSTFSVITINPAKYNQLYAKFNNLNNLLAWGHARAIENILEKKECKYALSDKFGNESLIKNALMTQGRTITLEQRHKAEDDIAVAAASILARNEFLQRMNKMSQEYGIDFPKGASEKVKEQARLFIKKYNFEALSNVAKLHFKTTLELKK